MKICFYEILGVTRDCTDVDIKKAYRSQALQWHPDKNLHEKEAAEERFKLIQEAYQTLSDPDERAFYDGHRNQILTEDEVDLRASEDPDINLGRYFDDSCFTGFDDTNPAGFFAVFRAVFVQIDELELRFGTDGSRPFYPGFGDSTTSWPDVNEFYKEWGNFTTQRNFSWASKWRLSDAPERRTRRLMEKENRTAQTKAKRSYTDQVTALVVFVRKRDPRVKAHLAAVAKQREEREQTLAEKLEKQKWDRQAEREAWQAQEQERILEGERRMREAYGDLIDESESESEDEPEFECVACNKVFKSEKQYSNHENSKKHKLNAERLRQELQLEEQFLSQLAVDDDEQEDEEEEEKEEEEEEVLVSDDGSSSPEISTNPQPNSQYDSDISDDLETKEAPPGLPKKKKKKNKNGRKKVNFGHEVAEDEDVSALPEQPTATDIKSNQTVAEKKRRRRRANQNSVAKASQEPSQTGGDVGSFRCEKCKSSFQSKTQLFKHLNKNPSHKSLK